MANKIEKPVTFILSTGRTGTKFFSSYLTGSCDNMLCRHEPKPSWHFKWFSNFYLTGKVSGQFVASQYLLNRRRVLKDQKIDHFVESSNFLFGCVEPVKSVIPNLSVIHIIRHPVSYTISHLNKGFWSGIKGFTTKYIPGWIEFMGPEINKSGDPVLILLARWIYVNQILQSYQDKVRYLNIRFEDVFGANAVNPVAGLNEARSFLGCDPLPDKEQLMWLNKSSNKAKSNHSKNWPIRNEHLDYIEKNGKHLLDYFGYKIEPQA